MFSLFFYYCWALQLKTIVANRPSLINSDGRPRIRRSEFQNRPYPRFAFIKEIFQNCFIIISDAYPPKTLVEISSNAQRVEHIDWCTIFDTPRLQTFHFHEFKRNTVWQKERKLTCRLGFAAYVFALLHPSQKATTGRQDVYEAYRRQHNIHAQHI